MKALVISQHGVTEIDAPDPTEQELAAMAEQRINSLITQNRNRRNNLLNTSDWTQIPDSVLTSERKLAWSQYRQALRDLTTHANWPELAYEDWPVNPDGNRGIPAPN